MSTRNDRIMKEELVIFLRNSDIFPIATRGVTTQTDTFTATAGQTIFTLTQNVVRNIRSVTVQSVAKKVYTEYTPNYLTASSTVTLLTGATLSDSVVIVYDYSSGATEKIWPDYPEIVYLADGVPRIGFDIMGVRTQVIGIGTTNWLSDAMVTIKVYDKNIRTIDGYINTIRSAVKSNQKSFYTFPFAYISNSGPPIIVEYLGKKIFSKSVDLLCRFNFES